MDIYNLDTENLENLNLKKIGANIKAKAQNVAKNVKTNVAKAKENVKKAVSTVADKAKELAKKGANASLYIPLLPLRLIMTTALKNKGVTNPPKDIGELAFMFHKRVIKGENTYSFDEASLYNSDNVDNYNHFIEPATITVIVTAIIQWVKKIKEKKDNNQPLDKEEQVVAEKIDEVEKELDQKIETAEAPKNWFKDNLPLILIVGAVIVFLIVRKK